MKDIQQPFLIGSLIICFTTYMILLYSTEIQITNNETQKIKTNIQAHS